jgi:hypothetical protein
MATARTWSVARKDAWGGVAAYRYRDTEYEASRGGEGDRFWVVQHGPTGEFVECPVAGYSMPTRAWAAEAIDAITRETN